MAIPLPADPYKALGVESTAPWGDIRKTYLKLVLKCHPDKIQDPIIKAIKVAEFHKIQEAWDLISDEKKRADYDEKVKINERSRQMRANAAQAKSASYSPAAASSPKFYDFEIRTAGTPKYAREEEDPRMYSPHSSSKPRFSDDRYDEPKLRKPTTYESSSRKPSAREMDRQRAAEEGDREYERQRRKEKERKMKDISESKRFRDKEKRRGTEEKTSKKMSHAFIVDDDSDEIKYTRSRRSSQKSDEKIRSRAEDAQFEIMAEGMQNMGISYDKYHGREDYAASYIKAAQASAQKKSAPAPPAPPAPPAVRVEELPRRKVQRAETYSYSSPPSRYPAAFVVDEPEDFARRSSGRSRRTSETPRRSEASRTSSMSGDAPSIVTVEPPSARKPSLQTHSSAPPIFQSERVMPSRSQTYDEPSTRRPAVTPQPMRSNTYTPGASTLRQSATAHYSTESDSSDSDEDPYARAAPRRPAARETRYPTSETVYRVVQGTGTGSGVRRVGREREVSPRTSTRRTGSSTLKVPISTGKVYYEEPLRSERTVPGGGNGAGGYFGEVQYSSYDPRNVSYSPYATKGGGAYYSSPVGSGRERSTFVSG